MRTARCCPSKSASRFPSRYADHSHRRAAVLATSSSASRKHQHWWLGFGFSFIDPPSQPCLGDSIVTFPFQNGTEKGPTGYFFSHTNLGLKQLGRFYRLKTPPFPSEIGTFKFENKLMTKIKKYYFKSISTVNALENHF